MQIAKMRLKFRNDIRAKQISEYKETIRRRLLAQRNQEGRLEEEEGMEFEALAFHDEGGLTEQQFRRMDEVITDFECNCSQIVSDCVNGVEKDESEEMSRSSSNCSSYIEQLSSLPKDIFDYSLSDLELIAFFCCQAETENHLSELCIRECISMIASVFYVVMEKYLPELINRPNPTWSKLYYRLKKVWAVCMKILLPQILMKLETNPISKDEQIFASQFIVHKVHYLYKYRLLANRAILQENEQYFKYLFNATLEFDDLLFPDKIKAAYFLIQQYGFQASWTANHRIFFQFIYNSIIQYKTVAKPEPQYSECVTFMLKMIEWIFSSSRSKHLRQIYVKPQHGFLAKILEIGLHLHKSLISSNRDETFCLINGMVRVIIVCQLYQLDFYHELISQICEQAILSNTLSPTLQMWALMLLEMLGVGKQQTFLKLRIHYTFSLRRHDNSNYRSFLQSVENVLLGL